MLKFNEVLKTDGFGLWSNVQRHVQHTHIEMHKVQKSLSDENSYFGELRVFFKPESWNTREHGLIYTDDNWLTEFRAKMQFLGFDPRDIDYSEQGMQGDDYVSLDCGNSTVAKYRELTGGVDHEYVD